MPWLLDVLKGMEVNSSFLNRRSNCFLAGNGIFLPGGPVSGPEISS